MSLEHLFDAELQYRKGMAPITADGEGQLTGSGEGIARGVWEGEFDAEAHQARYHAFLTPDLTVPWAVA